MVGFFDSIPYNRVYPVEGLLESCFAIGDFGSREGMEAELDRRAFVPTNVPWPFPQGTIELTHQNCSELGQDCVSSTPASRLSSLLPY